MNAPDPSTLKGKRDRAILALLISCGLRLAGLVGLEVDRFGFADIQPTLILQIFRQYFEDARMMPEGTHC